MDISLKIEEWLKVETLEEILEENDLEEEEVLRILFYQGLIAIPPWLEGVGVWIPNPDDE